MQIMLYFRDRYDQKSRPFHGALGEATDHPDSPSSGISLVRGPLARTLKNRGTITPARLPTAYGNQGR
ncbi:hypothetical protein [Streptomyces celluloflavus]|uniref:hypothetical protein n=1 Tax=Streptomyces celluloflavus TaxID=58344 RepID=UPI0036B0C6B0